MTHKVRIIKESDLETLEEIFNLRLRPDEGEDTSQTFIVRLMKESDVEEPMAEIHELEMIKTSDAAYTLDDISDGVQYARVALASLEDGKVLLSEALGNLDSIANGDLYGKVLLGDLSGGHVLLGSAEGDLDDIADGTAYGKVLLTDISAGHILLAACSGTLDDIEDGTYGKVLVTDIEAGHIKLATCSGTIDDIVDGDYGKVLVTDISSGHILLASCVGDLDDISNGTTYGKVLATDLSAGHIVLSECIGDLDDIADGSNYGKLALTSISAGKIIIAGLDSTVVGRLFSSTSSQTAIEAWRHSSDVTMIDGGKIYADTITANMYHELRQTYVFTGDDSLDSSYPFEMPFRVVSEMTSIVSVRVSFRIMSFRSYSTGAASGGGQTSSSSGTDHTHTISIAYGGAGYYVYLYNGQLSSPGGSVGQVTSGASSVNHTHTVSDHTHDITFGIYEESNSPTIQFYIDNGSGYGGASASYTTDQADIDITSSISGTGWKNIKFTATTRCRLSVIVECKMDVSA